jgi:membrane protein required for colicin V production
MNAIDLVVCIVVIIALINGWRRGLILQIVSLCALVVGIWIAAKFGAAVGAWLRLDESISTAGGFLVIFLAIILIMAIFGRAVRELFHFAGLGLLDRVLGVVVATAKYLIILSLIFSILDTFNKDYSIIKKSRIERSKTYEPILRLSEKIFPFLEWVGEQTGIEMLQKKNE